ncbi:MAG: translation initiation factor 2 [Oribacterium sp.]|nr:translation initiation factor 2 [Oribacterium sp.]
MVGKFDIEIYNNRVHYFLTVKRNITILQGDSASGKTELIRLIGEYEANGNSSGITVKCSKKCTVLTNVDWELRLSSMKQRIIFIDETARFLKDRPFAEMVRGSDNYFVIVSRDALVQLPYSIEEIYGIRNVSDSSKYKTYKKVYNEMYKIYNLTDINGALEPDLVITEDSNSGFECYKLIYGKKCEAAGGKGNVYDCIRKSDKNNTLAIVDGAAFGSDVGKIMRYLSVSGKKCVLYAPESFEFLLLKANIIDVPKAVLDETYDYADSKRFMSWEEYYTDYLIQNSQKTVFKYAKTKLNENYKSPKIIEKIKRIMPEQIIMK